MDNQENDIVTEHLVLCRHLVALQGAYEVVYSDGRRPVASFLYSCFIISVKGHWFLVTAGHILRELEEALNSGQIKLLNCYLVDYFGTDARHHQPVWFHYHDAWKCFREDEEMGLDFGLIAMSDYYRGLLEKNNVQPFTEEDWKSPFKADFDIYKMIGLSNHLIETKISMSDGITPQLEMSVQPVILSAERLNSPPKGSETTSPRFFAKLHGIEPLPDIKGMSGCPILGIVRVEEGCKYWVVAVQSSCLNESRIIIGCPVDVFMVSLMEVIKEKL